MAITSEANGCPLFDLIAEFIFMNRFLDGVHLSPSVFSCIDYAVQGVKESFDSFY